MIDEATVKFTKKNNYFPSDFQAVFTPSKNGNYSLTYWCSNRTPDFEKHFPEYINAIMDCTKPYEEVLEQAHIESQKVTLKAQQPADGKTPATPQPPH